VAATLIPNATIRDIQQELHRLDEAAAGAERETLRTRVQTHLAWIPPDWEAAARAVMAGLGARHPSRMILLLPDPDAGRDALDAEVSVEVFGSEIAGRAVSAELIALRLCGARATAPASVVSPLLVADLPVFLRWRGPLPFGAPELEQLLEVTDRLVVDSAEWAEPDGALAVLPSLFERVAVSDIAWARTVPWRVALAGCWPGIASNRRLRIEGPRCEALLLAGWLRARLGHPFALEHVPGPELALVELDGVELRPAANGGASPADLLSAQLEIFGRDPVYEEAAGAAFPPPA
jgi:glucose-6-phosphate dehydrogenase assembly protein OpcA